MDRRSYRSTARTGAVTSWRILFEIDDGMPDGMTVDEDGLLWIAIWGRGQVRRYDTSGNLLMTITVDAPYTSCIAFVGTDLDSLAITTAQEECPEGQRTRVSSSGALFLARPGVRGLPDSRWAGNTATPAWADD